MAAQTERIRFRGAVQKSAWRTCASLPAAVRGNGLERRLHFRYSPTVFDQLPGCHNPSMPNTFIQTSSEFGHGQNFEHSKIIVFGCSDECDFGLDSHGWGEMV
jgi:hypothetical protein